MTRRAQQGYICDVPLLTEPVLTAVKYCFPLYYLQGRGEFRYRENNPAGMSQS